MNIIAKTLLTALVAATVSFSANASQTTQQVEAEYQRSISASQPMSPEEALMRARAVKRNQLKFTLINQCKKRGFIVEETLLDSKLLAISNFEKPQENIITGQKVFQDAYLENFKTAYKMGKRNTQATRGISAESRVSLQQPRGNGCCGGRFL